MKKIKNTKKARRFRAARIRYCAIRHTKEWKRRKYFKKVAYRMNILQENKKRKQRAEPPINLPSPNNMSLIDNTEEVLGYFDTVKQTLHQGINIIFDISLVDVLTAPTIALLIANINDFSFHHNSRIYGNAPIKKDLNKLFIESGFYDYVRSRASFKRGKDNLLHRETENFVASNVAKEAIKIGTKHVFGKEQFFEPIYNTIVECMINTDNHADKHIKGRCKWWLYVYSDPNSHLTSYTFLDLGVGIFESIVLKNYFKKYIKKTPIVNKVVKNINLVDDLMTGKIQSRIEKDNEIRGKGILDIIENAQSPNIKVFKVITNDVKIDFKTGAKEQLKRNLHGTLLYWELYN